MFKETARTYLPVSSPLALSHISAGVELVVSAWIVIKLATPGRFSGSYVTSDVKSVMARFIFRNSWSGVSRNVSRLFLSGSDFDCFFVGSRNDLMRALGSSAIIISTIGKVVPNFVLNTFAKCCASCSCCRWSSPQGTCVALATNRNWNQIDIYPTGSKWLERLTCRLNNRPLGEWDRWTNRSVYPSAWLIFLCIAVNGQDEPSSSDNPKSKITRCVAEPSTAQTDCISSDRCHRPITLQSSGICSLAIRLHSVYEILHQTLLSHWSYWQ